MAASAKEWVWDRSALCGATLAQETASMASSDSLTRRLLAACLAQALSVSALVAATASGGATLAGSGNGWTESVASELRAAGGVIKHGGGWGAGLAGQLVRAARGRCCVVTAANGGEGGRWRCGRVLRW